MSLASLSTSVHMAATFAPGGALNLTTLPHNRSLLHVDADMMTRSLAHHHGFVSAPIDASAAIGLAGRRDKARARVHRVSAAESGVLVAKKKALIRNVRTLVARSHSARINKPMFGGAVLQLVARSFAAVGLVMQRSTLDDDSTPYLRGLGIFVYLASSVPDMLSFMLAPSKILMLLSSVEPLLVTLLTYLLLPQESALLTSQQLLATMACIAGVVGYTLCSLGGVGTLSLEAVADEAITLHTVSGGFLVAAWERFVIYLLVASPCLLGLAWKARQCYNEMETSGIARFPLSFPITVALSSALQHLALVMLGLFMTSADAMHKLPMPPFVLCLVAMVCMASSCFHICRGMTQAPPHIFVTLYYTIGALTQIFQSAVIFRDRPEELTKKAFFAISCVIVSTVGLVHLHLSQGRVKKIRYAGGIFGRRDSGVDVAAALGSIEPHVFSEELPAAKTSRRLPAWVTGWHFLGRA